MKATWTGDDNGLEKSLNSDLLTHSSIDFFFRVESEMRFCRESCKQTVNLIVFSINEHKRDMYHLSLILTPTAWGSTLVVRI